MMSKNKGLRYLEHGHLHDYLGSHDLQPCNNHRCSQILFQGNCCYRRWDHQHSRCPCHSLLHWYHIGQHSSCLLQNNLRKCCLVEWKTPVFPRCFPVKQKCFPVCSSVSELFSCVFQCFRSVFLCFRDLFSIFFRCFWSFLCVFRCFLVFPRCLHVFPRCFLRCNQSAFRCFLVFPRCSPVFILGAFQSFLGVFRCCRCFSAFNVSQEREN